MRLFFSSNKSHSGGPSPFLKLKPIYLGGLFLLVVSGRKISSEFDRQVTIFVVRHEIGDNVDVLTQTLDDILRAFWKNEALAIHVPGSEVYLNSNSSFKSVPWRTS